MYAFLRLFHSTVLHAESLPSLQQLVNFPSLMGKHPKDGAKSCVMCGVSARFVKSQKECKGDTAPFITTYDRAVCSACRQISWVVVETNLQVKWCSSCHTFCVEAAFESGKDGQRLKRCTHCRDLDRAAKRKSTSAENEGEAASSSKVSGSAGIFVDRSRTETEHAEQLITVQSMAANRSMSVLDTFLPEKRSADGALGSSVDERATAKRGKTDKLAAESVAGKGNGTSPNQEDDSSTETESSLSS